MFAKKNSDTGEAIKSSRFDRALKWVTALTAIISLFFAVQKITQTIADNTARTQQISELLRVASMQQQAMDYSRAWDSLAKAAQLNDSGDALAKLLDHRENDIAKVRNQRENLAMAWLANITVPDGQRFTDIVDRLVPVLEAGTGSAAPQHKADLLAHIGWSYFLRSRDGHNSFDPSQQYRQAIEIDPDNPYANAYWGHWILWQNGNPDTAREHFDKAVRSRRDRDRVRDIQLIAYYNQGSEGAVSFLKTIVEMVKIGEGIPQKYNSQVEALFETACSKYGQESFTAFRAQISGTDLADIYAKASEHATSDQQDTRAACLAKLNK